MFQQSSQILKVLSVLLVTLLLIHGNTVSANLLDSSEYLQSTLVSPPSNISLTFPDDQTGLVSEPLPNNTIATGAECTINTAINPTERWLDEPHDIATDGTYMYIVGYDRVALSNQWRIEKRDFKTGKLAAGFGPNGNGVINVDPSLGNDIAYAIAIAKNAMYVVGTDNSPLLDQDWQWRIEKRSLVDGSRIFGFGENRDGIVRSNPSRWGDEPRAIAIDKEFMYVAGFDNAKGTNNSVEWRIEKRRLDNGDLVLDFGLNNDGVVTTDPTSYWDEITDIQVDQAAVYAVGYEGFNIGQIAQRQDTHWRIEKRNVLDGALVQGFGDNNDGIVISNPSKRNESPSALAIDANFMYVVGFDRVPGSTGEWRIEKRKLIDGKLDLGFGLAGVVNSNPGNHEDVANAIAIDAEYMYVAGWDIPAPQDIHLEWRIEKRRLKDGTFDPNFYNNGVLRFNPSKFNDMANAIVLSGGCFRAVGSDSLPAQKDQQKGPDLEWRIIGGMR